MISVIKEKRANRTRYRIRIKNRRLLPRLTVFMSNRYFYAQIIDDSNSHTLVSFSSLQLKKKNVTCDVASKVGSEIAKKAVENNIKQVVFDKGCYLFGKRLSAFVQSVRENQVIV